MQHYPADLADMPLPHCTLYGYLRQRNEAEGFDGTALHYYGFEEAYREMLRAIDEMAVAFQKAGIVKGDCVSFLTVSLPDTIHAFYALNKLGAVCNFVDVRIDEEHVCEFIKKARSSVLVVLGQAFEKVRDHMDELGLRLVICQNPTDLMPISRLKKFLYKVKTHEGRIPFDGTRIVKMADFAARGRGQACDEVAYEPDMPAAITRTGGTTGVSKGVLLSNDNLNAVAAGLNAAYRKEGLNGASCLNFLPVSVSYGLACGIHTILSMNLKSVIIPDFDLAKFDEYVLQYKPNGIITVPVFLEQLLNSKKLRNEDMSYMYEIITGGDSASDDLGRRLEEFRLAHNMEFPIAPGYGLSEVGSACTVSFRNVVRRGSVGIPAFHTVISAFNPGTQEELPVGETGEICISGPSVMLCYLDEPEETAHAVWTHSDGRRWVHTGDLGHVDEDGFLFIDGRIKRAITRYDGHKMYPMQIEQVVADHPSVEHCVVVGVKDREHVQGKQPLVVVQKKDDGVSEERVRAELFQMFHKRVELRSFPVAVEFVDKIDFTLVGKLDYRSVEDRFADYDYRTAGGGEK